jgi:sugar (pentulose or hexulose) kinase
VARRYEPDPARHDRYDRLYPLYREIYPSLRRLNHRIARESS